MTFEQALAVIERLRSGGSPRPSRDEIRQPYDAIYSQCGRHAEPLRTHLFETPGLAIGEKLIARLRQYALTARTASASGSRTRRLMRI
jgi:hypothetical protein